jgi:hypothetical protein
MSRAWPFENKVDPSDLRIKDPQDFLAKLGRDGSEAIVIRIGMNDAQLVMVDGEGRWDRWVYRSLEEATAIAETLEVPVHVGEYPEATRVRIGKFVPDAGHWDTSGGYPEQGDIGPVNPYPENRPRQVGAAETKRAGSDGRETKEQVEKQASSDGGEATEERDQE